MKQEKKLFKGKRKHPQTKKPYTKTQLIEKKRF